MNKPTKLYHASQSTDIDLFTPRNHKVRDEREGAVVFATPSKAVASMFIVPCDDSWTAKGLHNNVPYTVISDIRRYNELDMGGAIYTLSVKTFECDPGKGMGENEWISRVPVKPINKEVFDSGFSAMLQSGVQVYVVDKEKLENIKLSSDHGLSIMLNTVSENQKLGININSLRGA